MPDVGPIAEGAEHAAQSHGQVAADIVARALSVAFEAKRWDLVAQLTQEFEALRKSPRRGWIRAPPHTLVFSSLEAREVRLGGDLQLAAHPHRKATRSAEGHVEPDVRVEKEELRE